MLIGEITKPLLELYKINCLVLSEDISKLNDQFEIANRFIKKDESFFFIVKKNIFLELEA